MWQLKKIPQILHLYWGNHTISFMRYLTVLSFHQLNPEWKIKIYYPRTPYLGEPTWTASPHKNKFSGLDYMGKLRTLPVEWIEVDFSALGIPDDIPEPYKADYYRWYLLANEGGVWGDMDILFIKPMENLYFNKAERAELDTVVCLNTNARTCSPYYSIGFLLSSANNEFYRYIHDHAVENFDPEKYQSVGRLLTKRYFPNLNSITKQYPLIQLENLQMNVVYAYDHTRINELFKPGLESLLTEQTIGVHWYAGSSLANRFENLLTEDNYSQHDCMFTQLIQMMYDRVGD